MSVLLSAASCAKIVGLKYVGSNYAWFGNDLDLLEVSASQARSGFEVLPQYLVNSTTIDAQILAMRASGQNAISLPIWFTTEDQDAYSGFFNATSGKFTAVGLRNITAFLAEVKRLGFKSVEYRAFPTGAANPNTWSAWNQADYLKDVSMMDALHAVAVRAGIPFTIDLLNEGMPVAGYAAQAQLLSYDQQMWSQYVAKYGVADTVGFSTIPDAGRIASMAAVYGDALPPLFDFHIYGVEQNGPAVQTDTATLFGKVVAALNANAIAYRPWIIGETFYNDADTASQLAAAAAVAGQAVVAIYQWPLDTLNIRSADGDGGTDVSAPIDASAYTSFLPVAPIITPVLNQAGGASLMIPASSSMVGIGPAVVIGNVTLYDGDTIALDTGENSFGSLTLIGADPARPGLYEIVFTETVPVTAGQQTTVVYKVIDQITGLASNSVTSTFRLDPGPSVARLATGVVSIAPGQTVHLGQARGGLAGDTLTVALVTGVPGSIALGAASLDGLRPILYTAPASITSDAAVALAYTLADQMGELATGTASVVLANPLTIAKLAPGVVEQGQSTILGTVASSSANLTVKQTSGKGALSLVTVGATVELVYTAPAAIMVSNYDSLSYTVNDGYGGTVAGSDLVLLDAGPKLAAVSPAVVVKHQSTVIGTVSPGKSDDVLSLVQTGSTQSGTVTLSGKKIVYTAPLSIAAPAIDSVSYTVSDQYAGVAASGTASVRLLGGPAVSDNAIITSTTVGGFLDITAGSPTVAVKAASQTLLVEGAARPDITDRASGLVVDVGSDMARITLHNLTNDPKEMIDLLYGAGGFTTAAQAIAALVGDGQGGSILSLGQSGGYVHIMDAGAQLISASLFKIS